MIHSREERIEALGRVIEICQLLHKNTECLAVENLDIYLAG